MTRAEWLEVECMYLAQLADELMAAAKGTPAVATAKNRLQNIAFCELPEGPATRMLKKRISEACPK
jgi:hypothetical protein